MLDFIHDHHVVTQLLTHWHTHYTALCFNAFDDPDYPREQHNQDLRDESGVTALALRYTYPAVMARRCCHYQGVTPLAVYDLEDVCWLHLEGVYFNLDWRTGYPLDLVPLAVPLSDEQLFARWVHRDTERAMLLGLFCYRVGVTPPDVLSALLKDHPTTDGATLHWLSWIRAQHITPDLVL